MAIASPQSVIVLIRRVEGERTRMAAASDSGMAVSVIAAARRLARKMSTTRMTRMPPSRSRRHDVLDRHLDEVRLPEDHPVDGDALGQFLCSASRLAVEAGVTSMVLAPGCFCTPTITAAFRCGTPRRAERRPLLHVRHVAHQNRARAAHRDDAVANLLGRTHAPDGLKHKLLRPSVRCRRTRSRSPPHAVEPARQRDVVWRATPAGER